jgi:NAD(P)-dependent dehydrogenase (short-subunit alcohol dehydrogenase family)
MSDVSDTTTIVVGASRGLGRGIATALAQAGGSVIALARSENALSDTAHAAPGIQPAV